jgi:hypothetical protein
MYVCVYMCVCVYVCKVKVKFALEQVMKAQRRRRYIALLFFNLGDKTGVGVQRHATAALPPPKRPGTHCIGGWVGPRAGLGRCGKSGLHLDSIPGPSSP